MVAALASFAGLASINFTARSLGALAVGTLLQGVPCGMLATLATTYAADVCSSAVADKVTGCISVCWVIGQIISAGVLWSVVDDGSERSIRMPISLQWLIPPVVMLGCCFAPESPWYLARRGRYEAALAALRRLSRCDAAERLAGIQELVETEKAMLVGGTYLDCFRGSNRPRTEIAVMCSVGQLLAGFAIASQVVYFMQLAGLASRDSFKMAFCGYRRHCRLTPGPALTSRGWGRGIVNSLVLLGGSVLYFAVRLRLSLRAVYMAGLATMVPVLFTIGLLEVLKRTGAVGGGRVSWGQAGLVFAWSAVYGAWLSPPRRGRTDNVSRRDSRSGHDDHRVWRQCVHAPPQDAGPGAVRLRPTQLCPGRGGAVHARPALREPRRFHSLSGGRLHRRVAGLVLLPAAQDRWHPRTPAGRALCAPRPRQAVRRPGRRAARRGASLGRCQGLKTASGGEEVR